MTATATKPYIQTAKATGSYAKLKDGSWGIRVPAIAVAGTLAIITKRNGATTLETIGEAVWTGGGIKLCRVGGKPIQAKPATVAQPAAPKVKPDGMTCAVCQCKCIHGQEDIGCRLGRFADYFDVEWNQTNEPVCVECYFMTVERFEC